MRAAARPHHSDATVTQVSAASARQALVRLMLVIMATAALLTVWRPTVIHAQATKPVTALDSAAERTHVVRAGESLWSLAVRFYRDGRMWEVLADANSISRTSTRPLLVGVRLRVPDMVNACSPGDCSSQKTVSTKPDSTVPKVALIPAAAVRSTASARRPSSPTSSAAARAGSSSLSAQTAGKSDAAPVAPRTAAARSRRAPVKAPARAPAKATVAPSARVASAPVDTTPLARATVGTVLRPQMKAEMPLVRTTSRVGLVEPGGASAARGSEPSTIFLRRIPTLEEAQEQMRAAARTATPAPRRGEYDAAPFAVPAGSLLRAGHVVRRAGAAATGSVKEAQRMLIADEVEITAPAGVTLSLGDRLLVLREAGGLASGAQVVQPGGVLVVTQADAGRPILAVVKSQSGLIEQGQALVPATGAAAPTAAPSAAAGDQLRTEVSWVENGALLPTLQSYVLLSAGMGQGVKAGDEFALVKTRGSVNTGEEQRIAVVRVVRSDASGSTAIVTRQDRGEIATGVTARRVARLP